MFTPMALTVLLALAAAAFAAPALAQKYGIQSIPALLFFKDGKVIDQSVGLVSKRELQGKLDKLLPATAASVQ